MLCVVIHKPGQQVARNIRIGRFLREMTQAQLAEAMGQRDHDWRQVTVSEIEKLKRHVNADELYDLAAIFDTTVDKLYQQWRLA
jgi:transcriptional regulator with XRE-family HTH domain